jgi:hypothetical protein
MKANKGIAIPLATSTSPFPSCINEYTQAEKVVKDPQNPTVKPTNKYGNFLWNPSSPVRIPITNVPKKFTEMYGDSGKKFCC